MALLLVIIFPENERNFAFFPQACCLAFQTFWVTEQSELFLSWAKKGTSSFRNLGLLIMICPRFMICLRSAAGKRSVIVESNCKIQEVTQIFSVLETAVVHKVHVRVSFFLPSLSAMTRMDC